MHIQSTPNGDVLQSGEIPRGVKGNDDPNAVREFAQDLVKRGELAPAVQGSNGEALALFSDPAMMTDEEKSALVSLSPQWAGSIALAEGLGVAIADGLVADSKTVKSIDALRKLAETKSR